MRKNIILAFTLCCAIAVSQAQIKVQSNGSVHIQTSLTDTLHIGNNLVGKQLQCHELPANKGENTIEVRASSLQAGMYLYSLLVDGRLVDTKRMILTE